MNLLKNFATVGAFTLMSRVLGFLRDILVAAFLGAGPIADAFFVAFKLPNLFRRLFAEGAFNSAFVPLLARANEEGGRPGAERFASDVLSVLFVTVLVVTVIAQIAAPLLVAAIAPGFLSGEDATFDAAVVFTRITFPYLAAMSIVAFLSGILNTYDRFAAAAFAPVLLNVVLIAVLSAVGVAGIGDTRTVALVLSWGVAAAGLVQAVLLVWAVRRLGFRLSFPRPRLTPGVRRLVKLGIPGVAAGGITQINIVAGTIIASFWTGAVSYLYYADRLYQLPLGVVGIAIGVALLPDLSRRIRAEDHDGALATQNRALEFALILTVPSAFALTVIPVEIIDVLFRRGAFTAEDARMAAYALAAYGIGLPAFVLIKVLSPGFFAREDTATPMWFAGVGMLVNVAGSIALALLLAGAGLAHVGIAIATSLAGWVNAGLLFVALRRRGHFRPDGALARRTVAILVSGAAMGLALWLISAVLPWERFSDDLLPRVGLLAILVGAGAVIFFGGCQASGAMDLRGYARAILRRRPPAGAPGE